MIRKIIASVIAVLALGAGVAFAATQLASTDGTQVCVNEINGLMRASSSCRDSEYAMTIGGGSNVVVTSSGTITVALDSASSPITLPLTGLSITGTCEHSNAPPPASPDASVAKLVISATSGTIDGFAGAGNTAFTFGGTSLTTAVGGTYTPGSSGWSRGSAIVTGNDATATITFGGWAGDPEKTCKFIWQATEAPN